MEKCNKLLSIVLVGIVAVMLCNAMPVRAYSYVKTGSAYKEVKKFRSTRGVWCWEKGSQKKKYFNTNKDNTLPKLKKSSELEKVAKRRAKEVAKKFSHKRPNGKQWYSCYPKWKYLGENITMGYDTGKEAVISWEETDNKYANQKHRRNILSKHYNKVGIAGYRKGGVTYWTMALGYKK